MQPMENNQPELRVMVDANILIAGLNILSYYSSPAVSSGFSTDKFIPDQALSSAFPLQAVESSFPDVPQTLLASPLSHAGQSSD